MQNHTLRAHVFLLCTATGLAIVAASSRGHAQALSEVSQARAGSADLPPTGEPHTSDAGTQLRSPRLAAPGGIRIHRASGPIAVDGVLDDAGWVDVAPIDDWYETSPGNNIAPKVRSHGRITYDGKALYVGLEFEDPQPGAIRAPITDRDNVSKDTDYGGVILDATDSRRVGLLFLVNARGVQYDSVSDDSTGNEDASPDFFWDAATQITGKGWTLEIRIPFSSLSYSRQDPQPFRIMLFRNYPRDFRYKMFTSQMPRSSSCFICQAKPVIGLEGLPSGGGIVVAPYVSGVYVGKPSHDLGSRLAYGDPDLNVGFDAKWRPNASVVIDATVNPDFSQVESDVAQIAANERFALLYPEKRPFFLEGVELLATPISVVSTRSVTDPRWGVRSTIKSGNLAVTALAVQDEGGGQVIIPGASSSESGAQDFRSWAGIARLRYAIGNGIVGALATTREVAGGGFNRLGGADFQLYPADSDSVTAQYLYSFTRTPDRPDLAAEWDGRSLAGHAALAKWLHRDSVLDFTAMYRDLGTQFRADDGFVPQVGIREAYGEAGLTTRSDEGLVRRLQGLATYDHVTDPGLDLLSREVTAGTSMDLVLGSTLAVNYAYDQILVRGELLPRNQAVYSLSMNPGAILSSLALSGSAGQQIDFANARTGTGFDISVAATVRPTVHLELTSNEELRWVDVDVSGQPRSRLFTARVDRLLATYSFNARCFVRLTGQYEVTRRSPELYMTVVNAKDADLSASLLFAYKVNWQSVVFVGYGDSRTLSDTTRMLETDSRQLFVKMSHAFQW